MKKTLTVLSLFLVFVMLFGTFAACVQNDDENSLAYKQYTYYVAYAESLGEQAMSYEQWLASVKGEKGDKGDKGDKGEAGVGIVDVNVELITDSKGNKFLRFTFTLSNGNTSIKEVPYSGSGETSTPEPSLRDGNSIDTAFTVADAIAKIDADGKTNSSQAYYVKAYVTSEPKYDSAHKTYSFDAADSASDTSGKFMVYSALLGNYSSISKGDQIVVHGHLTYFSKNNVYEIAYISSIGINPTIVWKADDGSVTPPSVKGDGLTAATAYTVAEVAQVYASMNVDEISETKIYVKSNIIWYVGTDTDDLGQYNYMYIGEDDETEDEFIFVNSYSLEGLPTLAVGDEVIVYGYLAISKDDSGKYFEMCQIQEDDGTVVSPIVTVPGGTVVPDPNPNPDTHTHVFTSYFTYGKCTVEGCNVVGRTDSTHSFKLDYNFNDTQKVQYEELYTTITNILSGKETASNEQFLAKYNQYSDGLDYVGTQYQYATVLADISMSATDNANATLVSDFYDTMIANYYTLYETIYNSNFKNYFYESWTEADIADARALAAQYDGSAELNINSTRIVNEYSQLLEQLYSAEDQSTINSLVAQIETKYGEFVANNNAIAKSAGYGENQYMEYAYANTYSRDYTPTSAKNLHKFVKQYIVPLYTKLKAQANALWNKEDWGSEDNAKFFNAISANPLAETASEYDKDLAILANGYLSNYFNYLTDTKAGINFYNAANNAFKDGRLFYGKNEGAYTWSLTNGSLMYFEAESYSDTFTFVHEFGHYYEDVYNPGLEASMDLMETHSQGNELLFLAWLSQNKPADIVDGFKMLEYNELLQMLENIILGSSVDEFEQAVYANYYNADGYRNGIDASKYNQLYTTIVNSYGEGLFEDSNLPYWLLVAFDSPAYYVSYAMSALPCVELYTIAQTEGLDHARKSYFGLFTFAHNSKFVEVDSDGNKTITATYDEILNDCGLSSPLSEKLYTTIANYFNK